ncbi:MAG: helix-turn-helix domain-containing protein [Breznakibacter sp.]
MKELDELLNGISLVEQTKIDKRMVLAAKIDQVIKNKGWSIDNFANSTGKRPELIREWLSGTFNFDLDTIVELEHYLGIQLITLD